MNEPSYSQSHGGGSTYRQYTYFDSTTRKYLEKKKKNDVKRQQNKLQKQRKQLARCTFRPIIQSRNYHQLCNKVEKIKEQINHSKQNKIQQPKKPRPQNRLLQWGKQRQIQMRNKRIEKQISEINLTKSLSKEKTIRKMNRSLEQIARSSIQGSFLKSIQAVPIASKDQLNRPSYKTLQNVRRNQ